MKGGLTDIPGMRHLEGAYQSLLHGAPNERDLALYLQWARFDARLAEICVAFLTKNWKRLPPIALHEALGAQPWPNSAGPLLEFACRAITASDTDSRLFGHWKDIVMEGFAPASWEQYFIGQRKPGGQAMFDDARFSLEEYRRWGYLAREILFNKQKLPDGAPGRTHTLTPEVRTEILKNLCESRQRITVRDYWESLGRCISLRQAERDLTECTWLRPQGLTRARFYVHSPGRRKRG